MIRRYSLITRIRVCLLLALSVAVALIIGRLIGWHWEFLPTFLTELVPGADLVPFWTLAVANVYRKWKKNLQISGI